MYNNEGLVTRAITIRQLNSLGGDPSIDTSQSKFLPDNYIKFNRYADTNTKIIHQRTLYFIHFILLESEINLESKTNRET